MIIWDILGTDPGKCLKNGGDRNPHFAKSGLELL